MSVFEWKQKKVSPPGSFFHRNISPKSWQFQNIALKGIYLLREMSRRHHRLYKRLPGIRNWTRAGGRPGPSSTPKKRVAIKLFRYALQHAKNSGVKVAQINMPETNTAAKSLMSDLDFRFIRHFLELKLDIYNTHLPDVNPGEFNMRSLQRGEEDKLTGLQNRCFIGSWGFNPNTTEDIVYRLNLSGCSPEDVTMAYKGDRPVGYCWTRKIL